MAELLNGDRVKFKNGAQRKFIEDCIQELNVSHAELASLVGVSVRTITDWKREKFLLPEKVVSFLSEKSGVKVFGTKNVLDQFWYAKKGASLGGVAHYKKYGSVGGDEGYRKDQWKKWWVDIGQFQNREMFDRKMITKPRKSERLAEFVGIVIGDGGITNFQVRVTLNRESDAEYVSYVRDLIEDLFGVTPTLINDKKSLGIDVTVSRRDLVDFCSGIGLKIGHKIKQGLDVPVWVKANKKFMTACVRGLVDTDGSVFDHRYKVNGKMYSYKKIDFSSCSPPLLNSVFEFLKDCELRPRIVKNGKKLRIESEDTVRGYMEIVGTSNFKHLKRYRD